MTFNEKVRQYLHTVRARLTTPSGLVTLGLLFLYGLARSFFWEETTKVARRIGALLPDLVSAPVGYFGLALFVWLALWSAFVLLATYYDLRPRQQRGEIEARNRELEAQLALVTTSRDTALRERNHWFDMVEYGTVLPEYKPLDTYDHRIMINAVRTLLTSMHDAINAGQAVFRAYKSATERSELIDLLDRIERTEYHWLTRAAVKVREHTTAERDPRPYLIVTYIKYQEWRALMPRVWAYFADFVKVPEEDMWTAADEAFRNNFWSMVTNTTQLGEVGSMAAYYDQENRPSH